MTKNVDALARHFFQTIVAILIMNEVLVGHGVIRPFVENQSNANPCPIHYRECSLLGGSSWLVSRL